MTCTSNALEGNSLTLSETKVLLEDGITVGGKPIRDSYEAAGHAKAYNYMLMLARSGTLSITEDMICHLHCPSKKFTAVWPKPGSWNQI